MIFGYLVYPDPWKSATGSGLQNIKKVIIKIQQDEHTHGCGIKE
jgi:hypothetical protein